MIAAVLLLMFPETQGQSLQLPLARDLGATASFLVTFVAVVSSPTWPIIWKLRSQFDATDPIAAKELKRAEGYITNVPFLTAAFFGFSIASIADTSESILRPHEVLWQGLREFALPVLIYYAVG